MDKGKTKGGLTDAEFAFHNAEREKRAAELLIANNELAYQIKENGKRAAELIIANKELLFQNEEKEKRALELILANKELAFQNEEKEKRAAELLIANKELAFQNEEKEKRAAELLAANAELQKAKEQQKANILVLEQMMFITSHKIRQPITQIIGLSSLMDTLSDSPEQLKEMTGYIQESAHSLDNFTRELTSFIYAQEIKHKVNKQN